MTTNDMEQYINQQIIPDLQRAGFDTALNDDREEDYVTLTIQRRQRYY